MKNELSKLTIRVFKEGSECFSRTIDIDPVLEVGDIMHFGNTGLTDEEIREYVLLTKNGSAPSLGSKARHYDELHLYRWRDVHPVTQLRWKHVIILVKKYFNNELGLLRHILVQYGIDVHSEEINEWEEKVDLLRHETEIIDPILIVIYRPDAEDLASLIDKIHAKQSNLQVLLLDQRNGNSSAEKAEFVFNLTSSGLVSFLEEGRLFSILDS